MTPAQFSQMRRAEDKKMLADLEHGWLCWAMLAKVEKDPFERYYAKRLANTADEMIRQLESKMVKKYL